jgi:hypothetical protein
LAGAKIATKLVTAESVTARFDDRKIVDRKIFLSSIFLSVPPLALAELAIAANGQIPRFPRRSPRTIIVESLAAATRRAMATLGGELGSTG